MPNHEPTMMNILKIGKKITCGGNKLPAVKSIINGRLNLKLNFVTTNAVADAKNRVIATVGIKIIIVFIK